MSDLDHLRHDDGAPAAYSIVDHFWPYDGPHSPMTVSAAATASAHLTRYLNNASQSGVPNGPALGRTVESVATTVHRFDQLLRQLARAAEQLVDDPTLYDDQHPREQGAPAALALAVHLVEARARLQPLRDQLDKAAQVGSRLGHRSEGE